MFQDKIIDTGIHQIPIPWWFQIAFVAYHALPFVIFGCVVPSIIFKVFANLKVASILSLLVLTLEFGFMFYVILVNFTIGIKPNLDATVSFLAIALLILGLNWLILRKKLSTL